MLNVAEVPQPKYRVGFYQTKCERALVCPWTLNQGEGCFLKTWTEEGESLFMKGNVGQLASDPQSLCSAPWRGFALLVWEVQSRSRHGWEPRCSPELHISTEKSRETSSWGYMQYAAYTPHTMGLFSSSLCVLSLLEHVFLIRLEVQQLADLCDNSCVCKK